MFKKHVLTAVVLVQSFKIINKTSWERGYILHGWVFFLPPLAPSE